MIMDAIVSENNKIAYYIDNNYGKLYLWIGMIFSLNIKLNDNGHMTNEIWENTKQYLPKNMIDNIKQIIKNYEKKNLVKNNYCNII